MVRANPEEQEKLAEEMVRQYLCAYRLVQDEIRQSAGKQPEPYKGLELHVLHNIFGNAIRETCDGLEFIAKLLSELIVNQALPNANHRTSTYFIVSLLKQHGIDIDLMQNAENIREYFLDSKHILKKGKRDYQQRHYETTRQFLVKVLGLDQSGKLGSIRANSFIVSLSASSKDSALT